MNDDDLIRRGDAMTVLSKERQWASGCNPINVVDRCIAAVRDIPAIHVQPITVQDAARVLLGAMERSKIDPFDASNLEIENLAIKHAGNRGDGVAQLEIAEEFFKAALRAIAGGDA